MFGIWERPAFLRAPVASAIHHASEVTAWAICGQLDDAHCDLVANLAVDDPRNGLIADLQDAIAELDLTTTFSGYRVALQPPFNRRDTGNVTAAQRREPVLRWDVGTRRCFNEACVRQEHSSEEERKQLHLERCYNLDTPRAKVRSSTHCRRAINVERRAYAWTPHSDL